MKGLRWCVTRLAYLAGRFVSWLVRSTTASAAPTRDEMGIRPQPLTVVTSNGESRRALMRAYERRTGKKADSWKAVLKWAHREARREQQAMQGQGR